MFEILPKERWTELTEVFRREFESGLPEDKSVILAGMDANGKVNKFVVLEFLTRIGQIWNTGSESRAMLEFFNARMKPGATVIAIASDPRYDGLCQKFGMRHVDGTLYRKDF